MAPLSVTEGDPWVTEKHALSETGAQRERVVGVFVRSDRKHPITEVIRVCLSSAIP